MTLFRYLFFVSFSSVVSWVAFAIVILGVDPFVSSWTGAGVFYASLWFALSGTLALIGFFARRLIEREGSVVDHVVNAFRQGILLSFLLMITLFLQSLRIVTWWNVGLAIVVVVLLEIFFIMRNT